MRWYLHWPSTVDPIFLDSLFQVNLIELLSYDMNILLGPRFMLNPQ